MIKHRMLIIAYDNAMQYNLVRKSVHSRSTAFDLISLWPVQKGNPLGGELKVVFSSCVGKYRRIHACPSRMLV